MKRNTIEENYCLIQKSPFDVRNVFSDLATPLLIIHVNDYTIFQLELLRLGYQQTTLKRVFDLLYHFVLPNHPMILYSGDIDMVSGILKELLVHMKNFPELATVDEIIPCSVS